jgi:hypothetical protein
MNDKTNSEGHATGAIRRNSTLTSSGFRTDLQEPRASPKREGPSSGRGLPPVSQSNGAATSCRLHCPVSR